MILRKTAFFVRHAQATFAAGKSRKLPILRKGALRADNTLTTLTPRVGGQLSVLREGAFIIRYGLATHAGDLAPPRRTDRCKSTKGRSPALNRCVNHLYPPID